MFESRGFRYPHRADFVEDLKADATLLLKRIEQIQATTPECHRLVARAKTELEDCVMLAVKAVSRE